jgi:putative ABC transport system permease protein
LYVELPLSYRNKIANVEGVEEICQWQWFGGIYQDPSNFFAQFGTDADTLITSFPEIEIIDGSYAAFEENRIGCVIGADLASKFGWKIGDHIPLLGQIFERNDGSAWDFEIEAIYRSTKPTIDQATMYFHFDYLRETLEAGECRGPEGAGVYVVKVADGAEITQVMGDIDALFENGPQRVQATTEGEFNRQFISMLGNVPALLTMIGGAVLFAIFFAVLNTMMMAARERVRSIGIMKALGFQNGPIVATLVIEGVLVCGIGGAAAVACVFSMQESIARQLLAMRVPGFAVSGDTAWLGMAIALSVGLVAGLVPGLGARKLQPVTALRREA